ncbi:MAG: sugar phosphate nucleotidyltransferase [Planctomycetota bacterium]|nr:sugar phosphate nucleotidyltransferase [Planctomycetota bacterium]
MKAIVLAAGFATRMYPLTRDRAKPLLAVGPRTVVDWLVRRILELDEVDELIVVANGRFHADFVRWSEGLDSCVPVRVLNDGAQDDEGKLGAIGDMHLAIASIEDSTCPLLIAAGDNLVDFSLAPYAARFRENPTDPLLIVREIEGEIPPRRYNEVTLDRAGAVTSFREKPDDPESPLASICLYFLPGDVRAQLANYLRDESNHDAPGYFMQWLHTQRALQAMPLEGTWFDIGNLEILERARTVFSSGTPAP